MQSIDPYVMPLGIITLEDVVEELIGEEIYDEFDTEGQGRVAPHISPDAKRFLSRLRGRAGEPARAPDPSPAARPSDTVSEPLTRGAQTIPSTPRLTATNPSSPLAPPAPMTRSASGGGKKRGLVGKMFSAKRANTIDGTSAPDDGAEAELKEEPKASSSEPQPEDKKDAPDIEGVALNAAAKD